VQLVVAVMRPFLLDRAARALRANGISNFTVARIFGGKSESTEGNVEYMTEMVKIEIPTPDKKVKDTIALIHSATSHQELDDTVTWALELTEYQDGR
jgi:nitrogen regulatory protein PII